MASSICVSMIERDSGADGRRRQGDAALHSGTGRHAVMPRAQVRVSAEIEIDDASDMGPAEMRDVGNRIVLALSLIHI